MSLRPDIAVTRQAIARLVHSLSDDPAERAMIAAKAAFEFIALDHSAEGAVTVFRAIHDDPMRVEAVQL